MRLNFSITLAFFALLMCSVQQWAAADTIHGLKSDYSSATNPNGVWTYGYFASDFPGGSNFRPMTSERHVPELERRR